MKRMKLNPMEKAYSFSTIVAFWMQTFSYVKILHDVLCILKEVDR